MRRLLARLRRLLSSQPATSRKHVLEDIFHSHGLECRLEGELLAFANGRRVGSKVHETQRNHETISLQFDVELEVEGNRVICESSIGAGYTRENALSVAIRDFCLQSFHVLLAAFFDQIDLEQVEQEWWEFASGRRRVTAGCLSTRGNVDLKSKFGEQVFDRWNELKLAVCQLSLDEKVHWCRFYFCQDQEGRGPSEFLLDNEECESMERRLSELDWPASEAFYSARRFFVIHPLDA